MSIGNTRDEGNKGNNFPWQLKMLLGQQCACDQLEKVANFTAQTASNTDQVEFLLTSILTTLQAGTEYEAKFVLDTCDGNKLYLEVRVWNTDTSTWGPITYYIPGSSTPVIPANPSDPCLQYADPTAVLGLILAELQTQTTILQDIDNNTDGVETLLTNILAAYSAGQQACASSLSVTLCTEQEQTLSNIEINTENTATNTSNALTELLDQGLTLDSIQTLITTLNGTVATEVTLAQVLTELQAINIDTNGLNQEATQLLVLTALNTVIANTTGLSTEVTLNALLTAFNAEDFATETTLALIQAITSQMTFTGGDLNVSANMQVGGTDVSAANPVPVTSTSPWIVETTTTVRTPGLIRATGPGTIPAGARSISVYNAGLAAGSILGVVGNVLPGEIMNFAAGGENDTLSVFAYDGTGTTLVITTIV